MDMALTVSCVLLQDEHAHGQHGSEAGQFDANAGALARPAGEFGSTVLCGDEFASALMHLENAVKHGRAGLPMHPVSPA
jgi:hypothetical protein